jgi:dTDP-4-amino-4,6-dideoxygalactose transaminase
MQFIDLKRQYHVLQAEIEEGMHRVLESGCYILGPQVEELEQKLADFSSMKYALTCSSGTDALLMALMAWGIGAGDAVFTTTFSFFATAEVVANVGAVPVFVDVCPDTFNIDTKKLDETIKKTIQQGALNPKAIITVDLFGLCAQYDEIDRIAKKYGLKVLEDAAQGFGGMYRGKRAGSFGDAAATSFFPAKPLGCYGDGGAVFTNNRDIWETLKSIRVHGQGFNKYENVRLGINGRLDTLQAAVLLPKLSVFEKEIQERNKIASAYNRALEGLLTTPQFHADTVSTWAQYSVLAKSEDQRAVIMKKLAEASIPSMIYYPIPLHLQKAFSRLGYQKGDMPVAEDLSKRIFSLPMHAYLTEDEIDEIAKVLTAALESGGDR